jgi:hypothetical protein
MLLKKTVNIQVDVTVRDNDIERMTRQMDRFFRLDQSPFESFVYGNAGQGIDAVRVVSVEDRGSGEVPEDSEDAFK